MESIPRIAYGIGTAWYKAKPGALNRELIDAIKTAVDVGYRHLDNAEVYGNEEECGVALSELNIPRDDLWITTKLGPKSVADPVSALKSSLSKLKVKQVDLYLIHMPFNWPDSSITLEHVWRGMEECKKLQLTRHIGVSNFRVEDLRRVKAVAKSVVFANQVECHAYLAQPGLLRYLEQNGIVGESYAPLAPLVHFSDGPLSCPKEGGEGVLAQLAEKYGRTQGQILLRWNHQKGQVVVTTSSKRSRMEEQLKIMEFELSEEDVEKIDKVGKEAGERRKYFQKELGGTGGEEK